jgi:hypothetical protein
MTKRWVIGALAAAMIGGAADAVRAQDRPERVTVPFSDPARPGTLRINLVTGSITVKASSGRDVIIEMRAPGERPGAGADASATGLRRLTQRSGFAVEEADNVMSVSSSRVNSRVELTIQVPTRTNLKLSTVNSGTLSIEGVDGDIEANNVNGPITLTSVAGSVVANSVNGKVSATFARVAAEKAMAFTSLNGAVDVTLPGSVKANVRLRSDRGDVYTDFDVQLGPAPSQPAVKDTRQSGGRYRIEVDHAVYGTINGGGPEFELRTFNGNVYLRRGK